jgi:mannose-6-phosphate isomerase-like protein (cupin superfamily)
VIPEAPLEDAGNGLQPAGDGWFVLNARAAAWRHVDGRPAVCDFEGTPEFAQVGFNVSVLQPGEIMAKYHWEADQENFLVLAGHAVLVIEDVERSLGPWDFVHCPAETKHSISGAGDGPCVVISVDRPRLGRLHGERDCRPSWHERRNGHERPPAGLRRASGPAADALSRRLAALDGACVPAGGFDPFDGSRVAEEREVDRLRRREVGEVGDRERTVGCLERGQVVRQLQ